MKKLLLLSVIVAVASCSKEVQSTIPDVSFRTLQCNMLQGNYSFLRTPGEFRTITDDKGYAIGYAGLIIGLSNSVLDFDNNLTYFAFDSACPVEADRKVAVQIESNGGYAACPKCGARYNLNNGGNPVSGSSLYLKRYKTILKNPDVLLVMSN